jgi:hypothetical protein
MARLVDNGCACPARTRPAQMLPLRLRTDRGDKIRAWKNATERDINKTADQIAEQIVKYEQQIK